MVDPNGDIIIEVTSQETGEGRCGTAAARGGRSSFGLAKQVRRRRYAHKRTNKFLPRGERSSEYDAAVLIVASPSFVSAVAPHAEFVVAQRIVRITTQLASGRSLSAAAPEQGLHEYMI